MTVEVEIRERRPSLTPRTAQPNCQSVTFTLSCCLTLHHTPSHSLTLSHSQTLSHTLLTLFSRSICFHTLHSSHAPIYLVPKLCHTTPVAPRVSRLRHPPETRATTRRAPIQPLDATVDYQPQTRLTATALGPPRRNGKHQWACSSVVERVSTMVSGSIPDSSNNRSVTRRPFFCSSGRRPSDELYPRAGRGEDVARFRPWEAVTIGGAHRGSQRGRARTRMFVTAPLSGG